MELCKEAAALDAAAARFPREAGLLIGMHDAGLGEAEMLRKIAADARGSEEAGAAWDGLFAALEPVDLEKAAGLGATLGSALDHGRRFLTGAGYAAGGGALGGLAGAGSFLGRRVGMPGHEFLGNMAGSLYESAGAGLKDVASLGHTGATDALANARAGQMAQAGQSGAGLLQVAHHGAGQAALGAATLGAGSMLAGTRLGAGAAGLAARVPGAAPLGAAAQRIGLNLNPLAAGRVGQVAQAGLAGARNVGQMARAAGGGVLTTAGTLAGADAVLDASGWRQPVLSGGVQDPTAAAPMAAQQPGAPPQPAFNPNPVNRAQLGSSLPLGGPAAAVFGSDVADLQRSRQAIVDTLTGVHARKISPEQGADAFRQHLQTYADNFLGDEQGTQLKGMAGKLLTDGRLDAGDIQQLQPFLPQLPAVQDLAGRAQQAGSANPLGDAINGFMGWARNSPVAAAAAIIGLPLAALGLGHSLFGGGGLTSMLVSALGLGAGAYGLGAFGGHEGPLAGFARQHGLNFMDAAQPSTAPAARPAGAAPQAPSGAPAGAGAIPPGLVSAFSGMDPRERAGALKAFAAAQPQLYRQLAAGRQAYDANQGLLGTAADQFGFGPESRLGAKAQELGVSPEWLKQVFEVQRGLQPTGAPA